MELRIEGGMGHITGTTRRAREGAPERGSGPRKGCSVGCRPSAGRDAVWPAAVRCQVCRWGQERN